MCEVCPVGTVPITHTSWHPLHQVVIMHCRRRHLPTACLDQVGLTGAVGWLTGYAHGAGEGGLPAARHVPSACCQGHTPLLCQVTFPIHHPPPASPSPPSGISSMHFSLVKSHGFPPWQLLKCLLSTPHIPMPPTQPTLVHGHEFNASPVEVLAHELTHVYLAKNKYFNLPLEAFSLPLSVTSSTPFCR